ncbi:hypothetical protein PYCC9005_001356 [Savitreella phatthalungensis]
MAAAGDPFVSVREDVRASLEQADLLLESYVRLSGGAGKTNAPEVVQTLEDLDQVLEDIAADVEDLEESVRVISADPQKYNVSDTELERRRGFVQNVKCDLDRIRAEAKPQRSTKDNPFRSSEDGDDLDEDGLEGGRDQGNAEVRAQEQMYQDQLMERQDEQLDSVFHTVGNLRMQARDMGEELGNQAEMLDEFEIAVDRSTSRIKRGIKSLEEFVRKNEDSRSTCCIGILIFVLILLLVVAVLV